MSSRIKKEAKQLAILNAKFQMKQNVIAHAKCAEIRARIHLRVTIDQLIIE